MSDESRALVSWVVVLLVVVTPAMLRAWNIGALLDQALEAAHLPRKAAAEVMGMGEPDLSRAIAGVGPAHLSADRLTRLPRVVWLHLYLGIGEQLGLSESAETRAMEYAKRSHRQAKAQLHSRDNAGGRDEVVA
jgi:hypothetical protein